MTEPRHTGKNIRHIRQLREINQEVFARLMDTTQQKVSKLENRRYLPPDLVKKAATVLGVSADVVTNFDVKAVLHFITDQDTERLVYPVQEIIAYFKEELHQKEERIRALEKRLIM